MKDRVDIGRVPVRVWGLAGFSLVGLTLLGWLGRSGLMPAGFLPAPRELLAWWIVGTLAALHRPLGGVTLGLGCLVLPLVASQHGAVPASLVGLASLWAAELARRQALSLRGIAMPRASGWEAIWRPTVIALAILLGWASGSAWKLWGVLVVPPLVYVSTVALGLVLGQRQPLRHDGKGVRLWPLAIDFLGWQFGLCLVLLPLSRWQVGGLAFVFALLGAEAARHAILRSFSEQRVDDLQGLQRAHERILSDRFDMAEIAHQVYIECRNILPVDHFQFEFFAPGNERSWAAGPEGRLSEGQPRPTEQPRPLPGIHRRVGWKLIEKELVAEDRTMARLRLWCDPRRIEEGGEALLASLVPQMASSVHRAWLDREAKLDPLTGVPVRRVLEARTQAAFRECHEEGRSMAVVMCDIDHFKRVNDTWGHEAGDQALVLVAHTLDEQRREQDLCCRYGGEEFTLLLENTSGDQALQLAERLRRAVESLEFEFEGQSIPLTLSAGVAAFPELHIKTGGELRLLADEALYAAKKGGRNRCLLHLGRDRYRGVNGHAEEPFLSAETFEAPRFFG